MSPPMSPTTTNKHDIAIMNINLKVTDMTGRSSTHYSKTYRPHRTHSMPLPGSQRQDYYNPATGAYTGYLVQDVPSQAELSSTPHGSPSQDVLASAPRSQDLWASISKIRLISSEVTKKHLALQGLTPPSLNSAKGPLTEDTSTSSPPASPRASLDNPKLPRPTSRTTTARKNSRAGETEESEHDAESIHTRRSSLPSRKNSFRGPTAQEFAGKREAIDEIMKKLDDLSCAVQTLHEATSPIRTSTLPPPPPPPPMGNYRSPFASPPLSPSSNNPYFQAPPHHQGVFSSSSTLGSPLPPGSQPVSRTPSIYSGRRLPPIYDADHTPPNEHTQYSLSRGRRGSADSYQGSIHRHK